MNNTVFQDIVQHQIELSTSVLLSKAKEYATDVDRLANFKAAAALQGITQSQALAGMMAKHTQSVYAMIATGQPYTTAMWDEKITDHINYLLLLRAVLEEEHNVPDPTPSSLKKDEGVTLPLEPWELELLNAPQDTELSVEEQAPVPPEEQKADMPDGFYPAGPLRVNIGRETYDKSVADRDALNDIASVIGRGMSWDDEADAIRPIVERVRTIVDKPEEVGTPGVEEAKKLIVPRKYLNLQNGTEKIASGTNPWLVNTNTGMRLDLTQFDAGRFPIGIAAPMDDKFGVQKDDERHAFNSDFEAAQALGQFITSMTGIGYEVWYYADPS